ncbi:hypothetical protein HQ865_22645 [Mucilaginibacter mali]|uniref:Uncharacterized protein n=1 Tax=Mucilaginibacter mali TaxID=2740462 RepID=A0A7D4UM14_9SPHI|nr:hypothetical protein [Mucilaginibacter mali]QKJ32442.1 hypothetical protein HQ865_22645 [Mucilaginibacter mali]
MQINDQQLQAFVQLYYEECGVMLSDKDAYEKASLLLQYVLMCLKPFPNADRDEIMDVQD